MPLRLRVGSEPRVGDDQALRLDLGDARAHHRDIESLRRGDDLREERSESLAAGGNLVGVEGALEDAEERRSRNPLLLRGDVEVEEGQFPGCVVARSGGDPSE